MTTILGHFLFENFTTCQPSILEAVSFIAMVIGTPSLKLKISKTRELSGLRLLFLTAPVLLYLMQ